MEHFDIFPTRLWKFKISSTDYDKKSIIDIVKKNYEVNQTRNFYNENSNIHAYYKNWEDSKYEKLNLNNLLNLYGKIISEWFSTLKIKKNVKCKYELVNINALKYGQFMTEHDHLEKNTLNSEWMCSYFCVHYLKYDLFQPSTTFINPLIYAQYPMTTFPMCDIMDDKFEENSSYSKEWFLKTEEDDFIICPSYLKHKVDFNNKKPFKDMRITTSVNVSFSCN
jgi:hypothetical protein